MGAGKGMMPSMKESNEKEALAIFDRIRAAMLENNPVPLQSYVAEDYQGCDAGGKVHGREMYLEAYGPGGVELDVFDVRDVETTSWAETVLVRGAAVIQGRYGEYEFEHDLRSIRGRDA